MGTLIRGRRIERQSPPLPEGEVLRLEPGDDPAAFARHLASATRVEIHFPTFGDGRGFTLARLLRERYAYQGELRAVGHVARDHLYYMESCGFDAYELKDGEDPEEALAAFDDFSEAYQASAARLLPLFRRRRPHGSGGQP
jgi:uncharacterized protein (DUF934 family)